MERFEFSIPISGAFTVSIQSILDHQDWEAVLSASRREEFADLRGELQDVMSGTFRMTLPEQEVDKKELRRIRDALSRSLKLGGVRLLVEKWREITKEIA